MVNAMKVQETVGLKRVMWYKRNPQVKFLRVNRII